MKIESVEIDSDMSKMAVMKHPGRAFPVAERLKGMLAHYRSVLVANHIQLPFRD